MISSLITLALVISAHAVFIWRVYHVAQWVNLGQGTLSNASTPDRVKSLLKKGFGQSLVLREKSGIGHAIIFWGFFVITFGTLEGLIQGIYHPFSFAFLGPLYWFMNTCQDFFGLLVMIALGAALYRRFIIKPKRLEGPFSHTLDALIIIGLIALLIIAFFAMQAIAPKPGFTPVADMLRTLFGITATTRADSGNAYAILHWLHNIVVLAFLAYIPFSKHLHVVTALPNLFFKQDRTKGRIEKLDLENEDAESFGIIRINDFTKKELLELTACTECGRCQEACPAYNTGKPLSPKKVILDLKKHLFEVGDALRTDPKTELKKKLYGDVIEHDVLWSCTTCFACEEACPVDIRPMSKLLGIRQARVLMEGDFPEEAQGALRNVETQSNPWGMAQEDRAKWAEGLGVPIMSENPDAEYLFFVGCAGSYDHRYQNVSRSLVKLLKHAGVSFGILGAEECCTGDSAKRIGNELLAQTLAQQNVDTINGYGIKKIVTACPHCFNGIKNEFPQYGGNYEVLHHTELLSSLRREGKLKVPETAGTHKLTYHDSCYLARYNSVMDAPRELAGTGGEVVEMPRHGEKSFCCGAGGGRMWMEERIGKSVNLERAQETLATGADTVATACPFCMTMLSDGVKREGREDVAVKDVAEILAEQLGLNGKDSG